MTKSQAHKDSAIYLVQQFNSDMLDYELDQTTCKNIALMLTRKFTETQLQSMVNEYVAEIVCQPMKLMEEVQDRNFLLGILGITNLCTLILLFAK